jgi:hypothetical protein
MDSVAGPVKGYLQGGDSERAREVVSRGLAVFYLLRWKNCFGAAQHIQFSILCRLSSLGLGRFSLRLGEHRSREMLAKYQC